MKSPDTRLPLPAKSVLAAGFAIAIVLAWLPIEHTIGRFIYDDMFYYLKVAQNLAVGNGSTFDGIHPTNGYHPLWMLIMTLLAGVFSGDMLVHAALTLGAVLHVTQGYLMLRLLARVARPAIALGLTALYILNWRTLSINLNGLEAALAIVLTLLVMDRLMTWPQSPSYKDAVTLGLLIGLAVLSRFDLLLLAMLVGIYVFLSPLYPKVYTIKSRLALGSAFALSAMLLVSIWFLFSYHVSGTLLPNSRHAVKLLTGVGYDYGNMAQMRDMLIDQVWSFIWWSSDISNLFGIFPVIAPDGRGMILSAGLLVILFMTVFFVFILNSKERNVRLAVLPMMYFAMHFGYYAVFHRIEVRYVLPSLAVFMIALAAAVEVIARSASAKGNIRILLPVFGIASVFSLYSGITAYQAGHASVRVHKYHYVARDMAAWLAANKPGTVTAAWNAGILGYYSDTVLINLDGVINDGALDAIRDKRLDDYILESGVTLIIDEPGQMNYNLQRFSARPDELNWLGPVVHESRDDEGRIIIARQVILP